MDWNIKSTTFMRNENRAFGSTVPTKWNSKFYKNSNHKSTNLMFVRSNVKSLLWMCNFHIKAQVPITSRTKTWSLASCECISGTSPMWTTCTSTLSQRIGNSSIMELVNAPKTTIFAWCHLLPCIFGIQQHHGLSYNKLSSTSQVSAN